MLFQAKTDGQLASEKAWLDAERVWVVHKRGFSGAKHLKDAPEANGVAHGVSTGAGDKIRVRLDFNSEILEVDEEDVEKVIHLTDF